MNFWLAKIFYSPLVSELENKTSAAEKQYQELDKLFKSDKKEKEPVAIKKEKPAIISEWKLIYDSKYSF